MGVKSELSLGTRVSNLKSVALTVLELLAFNAQNLGGHMTLATPTFGKIFGAMCELSLGRLSNLKSVALTVLELLAFNAQKFRGSRDPGHAPFSENFKGSYPDCPCKNACQI